MYLISVRRNSVFIGKIVKFWLKRDLSNFAYMSLSLDFIMEDASVVLLVVGLLIFPCAFVSIQLNVEVHG